jgi:hypothetical protein
MTTEQFDEQKKLLEATNSQLSILNGVIGPLFNVTNQLAAFLGSEDGKRKGILQDILAELREE